MNEDTFILIERYNQGEMTKEEKAVFEARLESDVELKQAFETYVSTQSALEASAFAAEKQRLRNLAMDDSKQSILGTMWRAAAVILIVFAAGIWFLFPSQESSALAEQYFEPYPDRITTMSASQDKWQVAMRAYNAGDFRTAVNEFQSLTELANEERQLANLYIGVSLIALDSCKAATPLLTSLQANASNVKDAARWYAALSALACDDPANAKALLEPYASDSTLKYKRTEALKLLEAL